MQRITRAVRTIIVAVATGLLAIASSGCGGGEDDADHTLLVITVGPVSHTLFTGGNAAATLTATATYADGAQADVTTTATWSSSNPDVATVDAAGVVTASFTNTGVAEITAWLDDIGSNPAVVQVHPTEDIADIAVQPRDATIAVKAVWQFTAIVTYADGRSVESMSGVTWSVSDELVATVDANGRVTGVGSGTAAVAAEIDRFSDTTGVTVLGVPEALTIAPVAATVTAGLDLPFLATLHYSDGKTLDVTGFVTWASTNPLIATINDTGVATGVAAGTVVISAVGFDFEDSTVLTVTDAEVVALQVTPATATVAVGATRAFTAIATYTDGTTGDVTASPYVIFASSDALVATIANAPADKGVATGVALGTAQISATYDNGLGLTVIAPAATLTVVGVASMLLEITPVGSTAVTGAAVPFTAQVSYSDGTTVDRTTASLWTSADLAVATISNAPGSVGVASTLASGTTTISATYAGLSASTALSVTAP
jgi:uncharacterized protein YjdB